MPVPSSVATHPERDAIEAALVAGDTFKAIGDRFGMNDQIIGRYANSREWRVRLAALTAPTLGVESASPDLGILASDSDPVKCPKDLAAVEAYCLHLTMGHEPKVAAKLAGCSVRSGRLWQSCSWWSQVRTRIRTRYFAGVEELAMGTVAKGVRDGDVTTAFKMLERLSPELQPAHRVEVVDPFSKLAAALKPADEEVTS